MNGMRLYIGIDPGRSGGIAAIDSAGEPYALSAMPETESDVFKFLINVGVLSLREDGRINVSAVLERVWASRVMSQSRAFAFGHGVGVLKMALIAAEIPFNEVTPAVWQRSVGIIEKTGARDIAIKKNKNIAKRRAQELFPRVGGITHATADALLIAEYCRRSRSYVEKA